MTGGHKTSNVSFKVCPPHVPSDELCHFVHAHVSGNSRVVFRAHDDLLEIKVVWNPETVFEVEDSVLDRGVLARGDQLSLVCWVDQC